MLHVSIKPEVLFEIAGFPVTNSILASWILLVVFLIIGIAFAANPRGNNPFAFFIRFVMTKLHAFFAPIPGKKVGESAFPFLVSIFLFVLFANWMGLLPGFGSLTLKHDESGYDNEVMHSEESEIEVKNVEVIEEEETMEVQEHAEEVAHEEDTVMDEEEEHAVAMTDEHSDEEEHHVAATPVLRGATADLNTTLALALFAVVMIQFYGLKELKLGYLKKFINFNGPIDFFIGILEIISEISKIISFAFRLFGNIFAGEVLLVVIAFLVPVLASFPFLILEVFVGVVQALVFAMLTGVFINVATSHHH